MIRIKLGMPSPFKYGKSISAETVVWRALNLSQNLKTTRCENCGVYFTGPAPIQRGPGGRTMLVCGACKEETTMSTITPMTRREQAEAYADLFEVPLAELYRRYGAVSLPPATRSALLRTQDQVEVGSGR